MKATFLASRSGAEAGGDHAQPQAPGAWAPPLAVIADDLTGALDTAVQFVHNAQPARVVLDPNRAPTSECEDFSVLVIDTESRHVAPDEASQRVRLALRAARRWGAVAFYKKLDSTLRGNVGAELSAMLETEICKELMLTPALPAQGRTVRRGVVYVHGVPLGSSDFARDPLQPMDTGDIAEILTRQAPFNLHSIEHASDLPGCEANEAGKHVYIFDATSEDDLLALATELERRGRLRLCAGSGGFAGALAAIRRRTRTPEATVSPAPTPCLPALLVCGSLHPASRAAVQVAIERGYPRISLPVSVMLDDARTAFNLDRIAGRGRRLLESARILILESESVRWTGRDPGARRTIAERLGQIAAAIAQAARISTVIAFGGDTSASLVQAFNADHLIPEGEVLPGVVVSRFGVQGRTLCLVTKAGGYAHSRLIEELEAWLSLPANDR